MLGPLEARHGTKRLDLGAPKQRALLARLLLEADTYVGLDRLIDELWPEDPPTSARHAIHVYVSSLRRAFSCVDGGRELIARSGEAYAVRLGDRWLDLRVFERLVTAGHEQLERGDSAGAAESFRAAIALWRGPALAELQSFPALRRESERLAALRLAALEARIDSDLKNSGSVELVSELEALVKEHPLREHLRMQLMLALYRDGRQAEALETYRRTRELFVSQLGIEPSRTLQELERAILRHEPTLEARPESSRRSEIPEPLTSLIGRENELTDLRETMLRRDVRLITLTGAGGIGKTRLAMKVAQELTDDYEGGVYFAELAALSDSSFVIDAIAATLGTTEELARRIGSERMLIVLDNFEHLLGAGPRIAELLRACPNLDLLATSRERLRLTGEHVFEVPLLPLDDAVTLFCERALAVNRRFASSEDVDEICRRLDGLPLAIELAAARVDAIPVADLVRRLSQRLPVLEQGPRDAPKRQQTLRATLDWSYELLDAREQELFAHLSVFAGGCTLDAATTVAGADRIGPTSLIDKNLLRTSGDRFAMLETVREYAGERLVEIGAKARAEERHADYYLDYVRERFAANLAFTEVVASLEPERANIRAALNWASDNNDYPRLAAAVTNLWRLWRRSAGQLEEGLRWVEAASAHVEELTPDERILFVHAASEAWRFHGDRQRARAMKEECLSIAERSGSTVRLSDGSLVVVHALAELAEMARAEGHLERARAYLQESLDLGGGPISLRGLSNLALETDDLRADYDYGELALAGFKAVGNSHNYASTLFHLADIHQRRADDDLALVGLEEAVHVFASMSDEAAVGWCLDAFANLAAKLGDVDRAGTLYGAACKLTPAVQADSVIPVALRDGFLPEQLQAGGEMTLDEAIRYALHPD